MAHVREIEVMVSTKRPGKEQYSSDGAEVRTTAVFEEGEVPLELKTGEDGKLDIESVTRQISSIGLVELHRTIRLIREKV